MCLRLSAVNGERSQSKILFLDDEPTVRDVVARMLSLRGYRVSVAANGEEARFLQKPLEQGRARREDSHPARRARRVGLRTLGGVTPPAIVVPGSSLARVRERLVRRAERVTKDVDARVVIFSGAAEAEPMRDIWQGPDVELVLEESAATTADNAAYTLPLLLERSVRDAIVVCAPAHLIRARWIFRRIYAAHGVTVAFRTARIVPTPGAIMWELAASTVAGRQVRERLDRA